MNFLVDMQLPPQLADWLNERGHDAAHVVNIGFGRATDEDIMERALEEERVIITADLDFPRILALTEAKGPGVILFRGGKFAESEVIALLTRILEIIPHHELPKSLVVADQERIRRRWLPIS